MWKLFFSAGQEAHNKPFPQSTSLATVGGFLIPNARAAKVECVQGYAEGARSPGTDYWFCGILFALGYAKTRQKYAHSMFITKSVWKPRIFVPSFCEILA